MNELYYRHLHRGCLSCVALIITTWVSAKPKLCFQMPSRFQCMYIIPVFPQMVNFTSISFSHSIYLDLVYHTMLHTADFPKYYTPGIHRSPLVLDKLSPTKTCALLNTKSLAIEVDLWLHKYLACIIKFLKVYVAY